MAKTARKSHSSLMQQGLLLVGIPLVCTVMFLSSLLMLLHSTELDRDRQQHAREIVVVAEQLKQLFWSSAKLYLQYFVTKNGELESRLDRLFDRMPQSVEELHQLVKSDPVQSERIHALAVLTDKFTDLYDRLMTTGAHGLTDNLYGNSHDFEAELMGTHKQVCSILDEIIADEQAVVRRASANAPDWNRYVKALVITGIVVTIGVALGLTVHFYRNTIERLRVLMKNTQLLAKRAELLPEVGGSDEIAYLDKTFHEMASSLKEVEQLKQDFMRMISHDLRAPLTSIRMTVNMLDEGMLGQLTDKGKALVGGTDAEIGRLVGLINELLDVEKMESGQLEIDLEWTALVTVLRQSEQAVSGMARPKGIEIIVPDTELDVWADHGRLIQVFVNLISNAIKFSPDGSQITLVVEPDAQAKMVKLGVRDQGRGVPAHLREAIFERFKQVEKADATAKGGTGLGLFICKTIVELHGGKIWVESEEGKGSTFWFTVATERPV